MKTDNELIAEFLGWERYSQNSFKCPNTYPIKGDHGWTTFSASELNFMNSWDWLMPVVEKIEEMGFKITFDNTECTITNDDSYIRTQWGKDANTKIIFVYKAVVEFIKWYNQQSNG